MKVAKVSLKEPKKELAEIYHVLGRHKELRQTFRGGSTVAERSTWTCGCTIDADGDGGVLNTVTWERCGDHMDVDGVR